MSTTTFDTLKFVERLEKAGATRELASALAEAQKDSLSEALDSTLATKADILALRSDLRESQAQIMGEIKLSRWMLAVVIGLAIANFAKQFF